MKKLLSAACTRSPGYTLPASSRSISDCGVMSIRTTSSAAPMHRVGNRLADADAGQLGDLVVEALEVLDVDGREHVDPGGEHVLDVLVALLVLDPGALVWASSSIRHSSGRRRRIAGQVHLLEHRVAVGDAPARNHLQALGLGDRLGPAVRLEVADHDVASRLGLGLALLQHPVGLADAGGHAEEDLVIATRGTLTCC